VTAQIAPNRSLPCPGTEAHAQITGMKTILLQSSFLTCQFVAGNTVAHRNATKAKCRGDGLRGEIGRYDRLVVLYD